MSAGLFRRLGKIWAIIRHVLSIRSLLDWIGLKQLVWSIFTGIAGGTFSALGGMSPFASTVVGIAASCGIVIVWRAMILTRDEVYSPRHEPTAGLIGEIRFDRDVSPLYANWNQAPVPADAASETATFSTPTEFDHGITMKVNGQEFGIDYDVHPHETLCDSIRFSCRYTPTTVIYARVRAVRNTGESRDFWFAHKIGKRAPEKSLGNEWTIFVSGPADNGWTRLDINLPEEVRKTEGANGWRYDALATIRLRGSLSISSIALYQTFYDIGQRITRLENRLKALGNVRDRTALADYVTTARSLFKDGKYEDANAAALEAERMFELPRD